MIRLRQLLTMAVLSVALWLGAVVEQGAIADTLTPEATSYQASSHTAPTIDLNEETNKQARNAKSNLQSAADNVREKLNLDQPIHPDTKEFFRDVQEKANETLEDVQEAVTHPGEALSGDRH